MTEKTTHTSVLLDEAIEALAIKPSATIVDATLGSAGHAVRIVERLGMNGMFIGIDSDPEAIVHAHTRLNATKCTKHLVEENFRNLNSTLDLLQIEKVDGILADLGWRMEQFSGNGKGFSFQIDEPLIMTYGPEEKYSFVAKDILNEWEETDIANVLKAYGEERFAHRIAHNITEYRKEKEFESTFELVELINNSVPFFYKHGKLNPATKTFQALRIAVNDELESLEVFIGNAVMKLREGGRLAIISFHRIEDRIVKQQFKQLAYEHRGRVLTKKPIIAGSEEQKNNRRARSAKLRIFEKHESTV